MSRKSRSDSEWEIQRFRRAPGPQEDVFDHEEFFVGTFAEAEARARSLVCEGQMVWIWDTESRLRLTLGGRISPQKGGAGCR